MAKDPPQTRRLQLLPISLQARSDLNQCVIVIGIFVREYLFKLFETIGQRSIAPQTRRLQLLCHNIS